ncbi:MAG: hypothetical protein ACFFDK_08375 [Promethearchaeota archaeon]
MRRSKIKRVRSSKHVERWQKKAIGEGCVPEFRLLQFTIFNQKRRKKYDIKFIFEME